MSAEWIDMEELLRRAPSFPRRTMERLIAAGQVTCRQRKRRGRRTFNWAVVERELALLDSTPAAGAGTQAPAELASVLADAEGLVRRLRNIIGRAA